MPWESSYVAEWDAVLTTYGGRLAPDDLMAAVQATLACARDHDTARFIADCRTLEGGHSIVDLYGIVQLIESLDRRGSLREAVVLPQLKAAAGEVQFWETACSNRGYDVKVFATFEEAQAWACRP